MSSDVQSALNVLWEAKVIEHRFDLLSHTLTFQGQVFADGGVATNYTLAFSSVSAFYFVHADGQRRLNPWEPEPDDSLELTSIHYNGQGIGQVMLQSQLKTWGNCFPSSPNFAIEIWSSWLLIEAKAVTINGIAYEVGYPVTE